MMPGSFASLSSSFFMQDDTVYVNSVSIDTANGRYYSYLSVMKLDKYGNQQGTIGRFSLPYKAVFFSPNASIVKNGFINTLIHAQDTVDNVETYFSKTTFEGDTLWTKKYTSDNWFLAKDILEDTDGGFIIAGSLDVDSISEAVTMGMFLMKVDSVGNEVWRRVYAQGSNWCEGVSVSMTATHEYIVGGYKMFLPTASSPSIDPYYSGLYVKFKSDGNYEVTEIGRYFYNEWVPGKLLPTPDDHLFAPTFISSDTIPYSDYTVYNHRVPVILKLTENADTVWARAIDTAYKFGYYLTKGIPTQDNKYAFVGTYQDFNYHFNYFFTYTTLIKTDVEAQVIWRRKYQYLDNQSQNILHDFSQLADGGYLLVGQTGDEVEAYDSKQKIWVVKTDQYGCLVPNCQYIGVPENTEELTVSVFPNPATDFLYVYNPAAQTELKGMLIDITGQVVRNNLPFSAQTTAIIPLDGLNAGVYFLRIQAKNGAILTQKIVKQ